MCKFCDQEQYNPISIKLDFGIFGKHTLDISISEIEDYDGRESSLIIDLSSDDGEEENNLLYKKVKIHYCPMCGEEI